MTTAGIRWEEPSPNRLGRDGDPRYAALAGELRSKPGQSLLVREYDRDQESTARSTGHNITAGRIKALRPAGHFQGTVRAEDGKVKLYARYVGDGASG